MPEVSFVTNNEAATPASAVEVQPAQASVPAVREANTAVATDGFFASAKLPTFRDIILPRINLVHSVGFLKERFTPGSLVYKQDLVLYSPPVKDGKTGVIKEEGTPPLRVTVLEFRKTRFVEKIVGGERGMMVNSEEEVRAVGGTLDYKEWESKKNDGMKRFEPLAEAVVLIERPAHIPDDGKVFNYSIDGKKYILALWAFKGTAYTAACKGVLFTERLMGCLRDGYATRSVDISTIQKPFGKNLVWVPVVIPGERSTLEMLKVAADIFSMA